MEFFETEKTNGTEKLSKLPGHHESTGADPATTGSSSLDLVATATGFAQQLLQKASRRDHAEGNLPTNKSRHEGAYEGDCKAFWSANTVTATTPPEILSRLNDATPNHGSALDQRSQDIQFVKEHYGELPEKKENNPYRANQHGAGQRKGGDLQAARVPTYQSASLVDRDKVSDSHARPLSSSESVIHIPSRVPPDLSQEEPSVDVEEGSLVTGDSNTSHDSRQTLSGAEREPLTDERHAPSSRVDLSAAGNAELGNWGEVSAKRSLAPSSPVAESTKRSGGADSVNSPCSSGCDANRPSVVYEGLGTAQNLRTIKLDEHNQVEVEAQEGLEVTVDKAADVASKGVRNIDDQEGCEEREAPSADANSGHYEAIADCTRRISESSELRVEDSSECISPRTLGKPIGNEADLYPQERRLHHCDLEDRNLKEDSSLPQDRTEAIASISAKPEEAECITPIIGVTSPVSEPLLPCADGCRKDKIGSGERPEGSEGYEDNFEDD